MFKTITALAVLATSLHVIAEPASAELSLRFANSADDVAPAPGVAPEDDGNVAAIEEGDAAPESAGAAPGEEAYILHCCPPPRGYTPIRCDPNAYNCFRAMRGSSQFPYRLWPGR